MFESFLSVFTLIFLVVDPIGNIPNFTAVLINADQKRIIPIAIRESIIAFCIMAFFAFFGHTFMSILGLEQSALTLGGGIVLLIISLKMLFPNVRHGIYGDIPDGEPVIFPIAVPMLAGPSALAVAMTLSTENEMSKFVWLSAIALTMIITAFIIIGSNKIQRICGEKITSAFERLMGLILTVMSVQMLLNGFRMLS